jgi:hypothetical protein
MPTDDDINSRWNSQSAYEGQYPPDWDARRKTVYRRDDWTCTNCGRKSGPHAGRRGVRLHAHHITPLEANGSNQLSNLQTLCESCHNQTHDHDITAGMGRRPAGGWSWIARFIGYGLGTVGGGAMHLGAAYVLATTAVGTPIWGASAAYLLGLGIVLFVRPRFVAVCSGLAGAAILMVGLAVPQRTVLGASIVVLVGLFWVPTVLAIGRYIQGRR